MGFLFIVWNLLKRLTVTLLIVFFIVCCLMGIYCICRMTYTNQTTVDFKFLATAYKTCARAIGGIFGK